MILAEAGGGRIGAGTGAGFRRGAGTAAGAGSANGLTGSAKGFSAGRFSWTGASGLMARGCGEGVIWRGPAAAGAPSLIVLRRLPPLRLLFMKPSIILDIGRRLRRGAVALVGVCVIGTA